MHIVITSINEPTEAVLRFAEVSDWPLIVIGDQKSPQGYFADNVDFFNINEQKDLKFKLSKVLPYNHYSRKMLGYLIAIDAGADSILDTDDDNIPYEGFSFEIFNSEKFVTSPNLGFVNIYKEFTDAHVWPRGLPLNLINQRNPELGVYKKYIKSGVIQGLANGSPDVDAIYRLTDDSEIFFKDRSSISLGPGTWSPFNSQNTLFQKDLFPLLYLPVTVSFRFTDILRSYVAQAIMWKEGFNLTFSKATVLQKRNYHNYLEDFSLEIPMYSSSKKSCQIISAAVNQNESIGKSLISVYESLYEEGVVGPAELPTLKIWLDDLCCSYY
jgi:hypothetical protein